MTTISVRSSFLALERILNGLIIPAAAFCMMVAAASGLYQVFSRFVLHAPAHWSEPLVKFSLIWMVYLGLMAAARSGTLIAVDFLYGMSSGILREIMRLVILLSTLTVCAALIYYGWLAVYMVRNQTISGLGVSASWVYAAIPFGAGFVALAAIAHFIEPRTEADRAEAL
ncbi:MAG: C4-dicarboxylate ABC transporter permease [Rhizobiales bacterium]|mgnify:CR=1 FL=1|nr:C4-dicarboxylate ABC transporter permease [Hyphomicrobiales bacterium]MBA68460.1 C4-dicarboxylate ABC transporter permease [Hyphomicrobiales bacterium]|tara:strand:- start:112 stop:621 length:510 start_codon:yes stop_codon:yes gene_type:complete